jgi:hypothetical protein
MSGGARPAPRQWLADDLTATELLTALITKAEQALAQRVRDTPANGYSPQAIADALSSFPDLLQR